MRKIAIFGTGKCAERIYTCLTSVADDNIVSLFCRTNATKDEMFHNLKVLDINEIDENIRKDLVMIIAIYDRETVMEIKDQLLKLRFTFEQIIEIDSFAFDDLIASLEKNEIEKRYICPCCKHHIKWFLPAGEEWAGLFKKYHIIGGGRRENVICPVCNTIDRTRWQYYVIKYFTDILKRRCNVLHIAPEEVICRTIQDNPQCDYYAGDIEVGKAQHICDLTDIQFKDKFLDYVIANHVLEHIKEIDLALHEIKRVLKDDGKLIISFPICMDMRTKEETTPLNEEERLDQFGQKDHVRLFGYDYKEYFEGYGFKVDILSPKNILDLDEIKTYGLIEDDVILICSKGEETSDIWI